MINKIRVKNIIKSFSKLEIIRFHDIVKQIYKASLDSNLSIEVIDSECKFWEDNILNTEVYLKILKDEEIITIFSNVVISDVSKTDGYEYLCPTSEISLGNRDDLVSLYKYLTDYVEIIRGIYFRHSPDFRSVNCNNKPYSFTTQQAQVVQLLYEAYENKAPELSQAHILSIIGTNNKHLKDTFKKHKAWGTLIISGKKGSYKLNLAV